MLYLEPRFKAKDLINEHGKVAVVGLPCHIWGFKKLEQVEGKIKDKILIHLGLFCGKCPNLYAVIYFLRKIANVNEVDVAKMSYRGKGWPGNVTVLTKQGKSFNFELNKWYNFSYHPHFIPVRCVLCYDITNQQADISLGDAWGLAPHDKIGASVVIARTPIGESTIQHLREIRRLILCEAKPEQIIQGQGLENKIRNTLIRAYIWRRIFRQPSPFTLSSLPRTSIKNWIFNLGYCTWLYIAQNRLIRIVLGNTTPQISKILKLIR